jgi:hypothetical protein
VQYVYAQTLSALGAQQERSAAEQDLSRSQADAAAQYALEQADLARTRTVSLAGAQAASSVAATKNAGDLALRVAMSNHTQAVEWAIAEIDYQKTLDSIYRRHRDNANGPAESENREAAYTRDAAFAEANFNLARSGGQSGT